MRRLKHVLLQMAILRLEKPRGLRAICLRLFGRRRAKLEGRVVGV